MYILKYFRESAVAIVYKDEERGEWKKSYTSSRRLKIRFPDCKNNNNPMVQRQTGNVPMCGKMSAYIPLLIPQELFETL